MDEGIHSIDPVQQNRTLQEPLLDGYFPEDTQALLQMNHLEGVLSGDMDGPLDNGDSGERSA